MTHLILISVSILSISISNIHIDLENIMNKEESLNYYIKNIPDDSSAELICYRGLFKTAFAEHVFWPMTKLSYFNEGKNEIEQQIKAHPEIVELKFIRLMVQLNAPSFLGYSDNIDKDFYTVVKSPEGNLKKFMTSNLKKSNGLSEAQKLILKKF